MTRSDAELLRRLRDTGDGYEIPADPSRAIAKLLQKLDDEDKNTFNWLMAALAVALTKTGQT